MDSGTLQSTRAHQARVPSWMKLIRGCTSGSFKFILPRLVPELGGLGYQSAYFENRQTGTLGLHRYVPFLPRIYSQILLRNSFQLSRSMPELCSRCTSLTSLVNIVDLVQNQWTSLFLCNGYCVNRQLFRNGFHLLLRM